ncbi:MAG: hypothetical protein KDB71_00245 [Mycobacterium sp.]|nr:hypothetical protein [Mycobacterium sp.]
MTAAFLVIGLIATPARPVVNVPVDRRLSSLTQFSAPEVINPLRGQYENLGVPLYPWSDSGHPEWPGTHDAGNRFPWSGIQPITKKSITRLVKATPTAFPDTQIVVAAGNPEITRQLLAASPARPVGIRSDCLGAISPAHWATDPKSWYAQNDKELVSQVLTRWKFAPVVTEWCTFQLDGTTDYFTKGLKDTVNYHVSMVASSVMDPPPIFTTSGRAPISTPVIASP